MLLQMTAILQMTLMTRISLKNSSQTKQMMTIKKLKLNNTPLPPDAPNLIPSHPGQWQWPEICLPRANKHTKEGMRAKILELFHADDRRSLLTVTCVKISPIVTY